MKKATILCIILLTSLFSYSQKIQGGLSMLSNVNWLTSNLNDFTNGKVRLGWGWCVFADYKLTNSYSFAPSLEFLFNGVTLKEQSDSLIKNTKYKFNYISLPLTLKMSTHQINYITYFGQFGIDPSFLLKARADIAIDSLSSLAPPKTILQSDVNVKSDISLFRLALVVGLGVDYNFVGSTSLITSITFNNGFIDILKNNDPTGQDKQANTNFVKLNVGIKF